ncbi:eclosion hormone isoform X1 [Hermetia illucens]|nr:eclosion hormone isoform X1 [Hermetia illucens]XP_037911181.1 eclosion hormone isoform X1 [Hermetia illucens]
MASMAKLTIIFFAALFIASLLNSSSAIPAIGKRYDNKILSDTLTGLDFIQICLNNCAQCKKMFGNYFQGQTCAESCLKFKGKAIPDCEDIGSIAPYLNTFE